MKFPENKAHPLASEAEDVADLALFDGKNPFKPLPQRSFKNALISVDDDFGLPSIWPDDTDWQ